MKEPKTLSQRDLKLLELGDFRLREDESGGWILAMAKTNNPVLHFDNVGDLQELVTLIQAAVKGDAETGK